MSGGQALVPSGVLGGGVLKADDYADFLAREYLAAYLPGGGAAVKVAVVGDGGAADRLESVSYGKEKPFCSAATEECYTQNRRAHFAMGK